jgi:hypothetical protein
MMDISQFSREAMLRSGDIFDMQAAPFGAVTKRYGFTGDVVMLAGAYFEFLAVSDMAAHVGLTPVERWEEVLKSAAAAFAKLPKNEIVRSVLVTVEVLDPDGQRRAKQLEITADKNSENEHLLVFLLPRPPRKKATIFLTSLASDGWTMLSEEPYQAITKQFGIMLPSVLTPPIFREFLRVADSPAHSRESLVDRWKNVLLAFREHFTEADIKEGSELVWEVPVLDPDGAVRKKKIRLGWIYDENEKPVVVFKEAV